MRVRVKVAAFSFDLQFYLIFLHYFHFISGFVILPPSPIYGYVFHISPVLLIIFFWEGG